MQRYRLFEGDLLEHVVGPWVRFSDVDAEITRLGKLVCELCSDEVPLQSDRVHLLDGDEQECEAAEAKEE